MASIYPYIHFNGNAEKAFTFYQSVFGGNPIALFLPIAILKRIYPLRNYFAEFLTLLHSKTPNNQT